MRDNTPGTVFTAILNKMHPKAMAWIQGNTDYPQLSGLVKFYDTPYAGVLIEAEIFGLPKNNDRGDTGYYAMHIHEKGDCRIPFDQTGDHYSREPAPHPYHSGDMLPLLGNKGYAWSAFYDSRITIEEIIGRSVIVHGHPDDFTTQPSGNAGEKIGCGVIREEDVKDRYM
ncbi:superoxide dismutase family protein [Hespellia stercorisuis]|uniref:Superoxide dismutase, Cu-Zn family n=1 Tax=Hespellia stercorisuis DSM 15480 TaxID=1121950 RepID=A0A1M6QWY1_9FIRM|nr:superoxide dismutase family protein [Hespellia stercorisuis]SHK24704.1 superoxide dismutase, Cu-Zn family [Hespellia stercorisuis DSM 15480]